MSLLKTGVSGSASASVGSGASASRAGATGRSSGPGGWHPTIIYMLVLIVAEIVIVGWLSRTLLR